MPKPYSRDLRERVVRAVEAGASCHEAAAAFEIGVSSAIRWVARFRQTGSVAAKPMGGKSSVVKKRNCARYDITPRPSGAGKSRLSH
jgi:transposase